MAQDFIGSDDVLGLQTFDYRGYFCFTEKLWGKNVNFSELQAVI